MKLQIMHSHQRKLVFQQDTRIASPLRLTRGSRKTEMHA